eukprot:jgi/Astpho2/1756/Aster-04177
MHQLPSTIQVAAAAAWQRAAATACAILLSSSSPALAGEDLTIKFMASADPEVRRQQTALVEAWGHVQTSFMDRTFGGSDWKQTLQDSLDASFKARNESEAMDVIDIMLKKLGDPFTRQLRPKQSALFRDTTDGQIFGLGFQVLPDPSNPQTARVAFVAESSPAEKADIRVGDQLVKLNGKAVDARDRQQLATDLRMEADLLLRRQSPSVAQLWDSSAGAAEQPETQEAQMGNSTTVATSNAQTQQMEPRDSTAAAAREPETQELSLHLLPGPIEVHPVQYAVLPGENGSSAGYLRLTVFSQNAPADVAEALRSLQKDGVSSVILDLRANAGGVIASGYNIAQLLLQNGQDIFCYVQDPSGTEEEVRITEVHPLLKQKQPLAVLVNGGTASTSELLAGALRDDSTNATLIGEKTFGKGTTQKVLPLSNGSTVLVSSQTFTLPKHEVLNKVGLQPDVACKPDEVVEEFWQAGSTDTSSLKDDPCIRMAQEHLEHMLSS